MCFAGVFRQFVITPAMCPEIFVRRAADKACIVGYLTVFPVLLAAIASTFTFPGAIYSVGALHIALYIFPDTEHF